MSHAHVCDQCLKVAPLDEAIGWWSLEAIGDTILLDLGRKTEYHFCSWRCAYFKIGAYLENPMTAERR